MLNCRMLCCRFALRPMLKPRKNIPNVGQVTTRFTCRMPCLLRTGAGRRSNPPRRAGPTRTPGGDHRRRASYWRRRFHETTGHAERHPDWRERPSGPACRYLELSYGERNISLQVCITLSCVIFVFQSLFRRVE